jgi:uncharacterized protein
MEAISEGQQRNVELARQGMEAYNQGDLGKLVELLAPDVMIYSPPTLANAGTYRGRDGFAQWVQNWDEAWESFEIEINEAAPLGDRFVLVDVHQRGRGRGSGVPVEREATYAFELRDGAITYISVHPDHESAVADARDRDPST